MTFPEVQIRPDESLDTALERVATVFQSAGLPAENIPLINEKLLSREFARCLWVISDRSIHVFLITSTAWNENGEILVLNDLWRLRRRLKEHYAPHFHFLSAFPVPPQLAYYFRGRAGTFFALDVLFAIQQRVTTALTGDTVRDIAVDVGRLAATYFGGDWDLNNVKTLALIDENVLREIRTQTDHDAEEDGYEPLTALIGLGCVAADVIYRNVATIPGCTVLWTYSELHGKGVAILQVATARGEESLLSPIQKVIKLFNQGAQDSLSFYYGVLSEQLGIGNRR
jgi:hypothetical protein